MSREKRLDHVWQLVALAVHVEEVLLPVDAIDVVVDAEKTVVVLTPLTGDPYFLNRAKEQFSADLCLKFGHTSLTRTVWVSSTHSSAIRLNIAPYLPSDREA